jgi:hypothetical protein
MHHHVLGFLHTLVNLGCIIISGVDLNVSSVSLQKTQTTQKVRLDLNMIRNPWCVHNRLFNANLEDKFK